MPEEKRPASPPITGSLRDALRTFVAFFVAFGFAKLTNVLGDSAQSVDLTGAQEAVVVIIVSAILAFAGKAFRNKGVSVGKVI